MTTYVALLRGINVGGRHKVAMADLKALLAEAGGENVSTYIQSGNAVLTHPARSPDKLAADLGRRIEAMTGFPVAVIVRTAAAMAAVVRKNPFPGREASLHVTFLSDDPPPGALDAVDAEAFLPEEFALVEREIYLHLPNGMARTKLPQALDVFATPVTTRNWRTVDKLAEMAGG
ncbi:MAG: DUF1697 domain-containing protein [Actinomycetota bacterium]|nr:DUF1697 domain-containing protein [Actinomycetota bacterium]